MHIIIGILTAIAGLIWALTALRRTGFSEKEFQIDNKTANDLLTASSYYLKNISSLKGKLKKVLTKSKERFTPHQIELAASMFERISISEGQASEEQIALITEFKQQFS